MSKRSINRAKRAGHAEVSESTFNRRLRRARALLAECPGPLEDSGIHLLARLLAAEEGVEPADTECAAEYAFDERAWLSERLRRPGKAPKHLLGRTTAPANAKRAP